MPGMKHSTIKKVIHKKISHWLSHVGDDKIAELARDNAIVSGGCIPSMLLGEEVNDYDVYFKSYGAAALVAEHYVNQFNASKGKLKTYASADCNPHVKYEKRVNIRGDTEDRIVIYMKSAGAAGESQDEYKYFEGQQEVAADAFVDSLSTVEAAYAAAESDPIGMAENLREDLKEAKKEYRPVFFSENAITLAGRVQLITRFYGPPEKIHENYDFAHCMCWYDLAKDELHVPQEASESLLSKALLYKGSLYPVASVFRTRKFIQRGWRITAGQMLKMLMQVSEIDLHDKETLKDQLIGVDVAYMHQLIAALQSDDAKRVDSAYLAKLIDGIFE